MGGRDPAACPLKIEASPSDTASWPVIYIMGVLGSIIRFLNGNLMYFSDADHTVTCTEFFYSWFL